MIKPEERIKKLEEEVEILKKRIVSLCDHKARQEYRMATLPFGGPLINIEECCACGRINIISYFEWKKKKNKQEKIDDVEKAESLLFKHGMKIK